MKDEPGPCRRAWLSGFPPDPCQSPPTPSDRREKEKKKKQLLVAGKGWLSCPLCRDHLVGQQDGAFLSHCLQTRGKTKQPGELAQLPASCGRDAAGREVVLWDDPCQRPWWLTPLPRHGDSKGHHLAAARRGEGSQPLRWLCAPAPPVPSTGDSQATSDALLIPSMRSLGKRRSAARRVFVFFSAPVIKHLFFVSPPTPLSAPVYSRLTSEVTGMGAL